MSRKQNKIIRRRMVGSFVSSVISISLVLVLVGVASLIAINASAVEDYFRENLHVTVLLKKDTPAQYAVAYQRKIEREPFVKETRYVSVQEGTMELQKMLGEDFLDVFETSPVPSSVEVTVHARYMNPDSLDFVCSRLAASPLVDEVSCPSAIVESMGDNVRKAGFVLGIIVALLLFISVVLINGTVRLGLYANRFTIHTMQLVGATNSFIARPYMGRAFLQGFVSALLAIGIIAGGLYFAQKSFPQLFEIFTIQALAESGAIVLVLGIVICRICSRSVLKKIVRLDNDELYG